MESVSASDWTTHELCELVEFFTWLDALCAEAMRRGHRAPWPNSNRMQEGLNYWIVHFGRGMTPTQALEHYDSLGAAQAPR
jgi:hypothetical protein